MSTPVTVEFLDGFIIRGKADSSDSSALELACEQCDGHLLDVEDGDTVGLLAEAAQKHAVGGCDQ